jgi:hypothetical protein
VIAFSAFGGVFRSFFRDNESLAGGAGRRDHVIPLSCKEAPYVRSRR